MDPLTLGLVLAGLGIAGTLITLFALSLMVDLLKRLFPPEVPGPRSQPEVPSPKSQVPGQSPESQVQSQTPTGGEKR